jgi:hypothetical protein
VPREKNHWLGDCGWSARYKRIHYAIVRRKAGEIIMTMLSTSLHCIVGALLVISNDFRRKVEMKLLRFPRN